jgi:putative transposase
MTYNRNLHHRRSVRLKSHDYTQAGIYFVTLCTRDRVPHWTQAPLRAIAASAWQAIPNHAAGVSLDEWVIMPNHLHGLLVLTPGPDQTDRRSPPRPEPSAHSSARLAPQSPPSASLAVILRTYKSAVTLACRRAGHSGFAWQTGYYEHVVRDQLELERVRQYIRNNPAQWALDHDNPDYHGRPPTATPWNE